MSQNKMRRLNRQSLLNEIWSPPKPNSSWIDIKSQTGIFFAFQNCSHLCWGLVATVDICLIFFSLYNLAFVLWHHFISFSTALLNAQINFISWHLANGAASHSKAKQEWHSQPTKVCGLKKDVIVRTIICHMDFTCNAICTFLQLLFTFSTRI